MSDPKQLPAEPAVPLSPIVRSLDWEDVKNAANRCKCGCPFPTLLKDGDGLRSYLECEFCGHQSESSETPDIVLGSWNHRGGPCEDCGGLCDEEGDELCAKCCNASLDAANQQRLDRIAAGWTVDGTGAIHPPNPSVVSPAEPAKEQS